MKKFAFLLAFALVSAFALSNFTTIARNPTIAEKFAALGARDEGAAGTYGFDKNHSSIGFRVKHMGLVDVPGYFRDFTGAVNYDPKDVTKSTVEFTAKITSVDTGVKGRDDHLRTADFFDVAKFPDMTFKSTKIEKKGKDLMVTGDLAMHGITKSISFPITIAGFLKSDRGTTLGATAETVVSRKDFGVGNDRKLPNGAEALSDNITVVLNIEANMAAPKPETKTAE